MITKKEKRKKKKDAIKRFCSYYKPYKKQFFLDLLCSFAIAVSNMFYPMVARRVMNEFVPDRNLQLIIVWSAVLALIYLAKSVLTYVVTYFGHVLGVKIQGDMRRELFRHVETLSFSYFDGHKTGGVMSRIVNDLFEVSELAHHAPEELFNSVLSIAGALILVCTQINPYLALIILLYVPFMVFFASKARYRMSRASTKARKKIAVLNAELESSVSGVRVTKAYDAETAEAKKFDAANDKFKIASAGRYKAMGLFQSGMSAFNDFLYLLALVSGSLFCYFGKITFADLTAYILYINMLIAPLRTLVTMFEQIDEGATGFRRFCELMDTPSEYEPACPVRAELNGDIVFDNVTFSYKTAAHVDGDGEEDAPSANEGENVIGCAEEGASGGEDVLKGVSFTVKKGSTAAFVGPSGGGKTTICHLLPRFYVRDGGKITIGGVDVNDVSAHDLRRKIAVVAQDVFLFAGTIRDNIAYGAENATNEQIVEAAKRANVHEFVMSLPHGYDTEVGERGVKLSGGQKQRVSIARAFLKNPPILVLDEATSALDNVTEMQIQSALAALSEGRTTFVVAHRLSTVKHADEIFVVENGKITERGTHDTLTAADGLYAKLYRYQFREN
ncbi:MAG: ABC transporter ATP-binding protein [Candidatus Borkfalkiaceae bacterium]|nr:ABC transporter ATP-binding protein [Clostridia bacterium]MDY6222673.1 ABC transporter ATP-binding protein [Christensenellaceae bacterium]